MVVPKGAGGGDHGKGTAEAFRLVAPKERTYDAKWWERVVAGEGGVATTNDSPPLRYLSGTEVARLMGFPLKNEDGGKLNGTTFEFPDWCTEKQKWRLLGNSINVAVAARVAEVGIRICLT